jgi:Flp pilus assembly protein TadB
MLSHEDRRQLEAIERHLASEDPELARKLTTWRPRTWRWNSVAAALLLVCAVLGLVSGLLVHSIVIFAVGGVAPLAGWAWLRRKRTRRRKE